MALKKKITKTEYEKLATHFQGEYKADGDNFVLDIDGEEDIGALKRAKDREVQRAKDLEDENKKLKAEKDEADRKAAEGADADLRKKGDIANLEKSWETKFNKQKEENAKLLERRDNFLRQQLVDNVAIALAGEISTAPKVMLPHIRARLTADLEGEKPVTKILDPDGKINPAATIEDLKKELIANPDFATIMIGSRATGGGANDKRTVRSSSATTGDDNKPVDLTKLSPKDLAKAANARKTEREAAQA